MKYARNPIKRFFASFLLTAFLLSLIGCASSGGGGIAGGGGLGQAVKQGIDGKLVDPAKQAKAPATSSKISVIVPTFDPNLPEDSDVWAKHGIFRELRNTEATRFAVNLKSALEETKAFGPVWVAPDTGKLRDNDAFVRGDLYLRGKILKSNGEDIHINITATDASGKKWFTKEFKHRVKSEFHTNPRNKGMDAYAPAFTAAAQYTADKLKKRKSKELVRVQRIAETRFGRDLSNETFDPYLVKKRNGTVDLNNAPADDDPAVQRMRALRVQDQLFLDDMQNHYAGFNQQLNESYTVWQEQSLFAQKEARKLKRKSIGQGILGGLLVVAGVAAAVNSADVNNSVGDQILLETAATVAAIGAAAAISASFLNRGRMKAHSAALIELGESINVDFGPQVVAYEKETVKLTGDTAQQHAQWRDFLKRLYELEATPEKQL